MDNGAQINSETMGEGNGGYISISAIESVLLTKQSGITTSASSDISTSNAGNVVIETGLLMLDNSSIQTTAIAGNGGNIDISANNIIVTSDSTIDASSELAVSGRINITTRNDIKSSLTKLPDTTNNVEDLFKNECDINREASQFRISKNSLIHSNHLQSPSSYFMNDIQSSSTSTVQKDNFYYKEDVETFQQLAQLYNDLMDLTYKGCLISSATN